MERYLFASDLRFNPRPTDGTRSEQGRSFDSASEVAAADIYNACVCLVYALSSTADQLLRSPIRLRARRRKTLSHSNSILQSLNEILVGASSRNEFRRLNCLMLVFGYTSLEPIIIIPHTLPRH